MEAELLVAWSGELCKQYQQREQRSAPPLASDEAPRTRVTRRAPGHPVQRNSKIAAKGRAMEAEILATLRLTPQSKAYFRAKKIGSRTGIDDAVARLVEKGLIERWRTLTRKEQRCGHPAVLYRVKG